MAHQWNADLYQQSHSFVWQYGRDLIALLAPQPGERILDVGCGTGQLTVEVARSGAEVVGIDSSAAMIEQAHANFPELTFRVEDVRALTFDGEFDAVFSNAALHWVQPPDAAAAAMARALKPGGRLVAEFGGHGNIAEIMRAAKSAWKSVGAGSPPPHPWYYPSIGEYATQLEGVGLEVTFAILFDRPTPLDGGPAGLARWFEMFGAHWTAPLEPARRAAFVEATERAAGPKLLRDALWSADYRRLRVVARK